MKKIILISAMLLLSIILSTSFIMSAEGSSSTPISETVTATLTVPGWMSLTVSNPPDFGTMPPNNRRWAEFPQLIASIGPETNVIVDVLTHANDTHFRSGINSFPVDNMDFFKLIPFSWIPYTTTPQEVCTNLEFNEFCIMLHRLTIPAGQQAGLYTTGITITAQEHDE